jgi:hypothetical protein
MKNPPYGCFLLLLAAIVVMLVRQVQLMQKRVVCALQHLDFAFPFPCIFELS